MRRQRGSVMRSRSPLLQTACLSRPAVRLLIPVVLLGLWVMQGMSATMESGCHGMVPTSLAASMNESMSDSSSMSPMSPALTETGVTSAAPAGSAESESGEPCVSGQPPTPGDWALALLAALALLGCIAPALLVGQPRLRNAAGACRWRAPPDPAGRELLATVCVSRT
jgi:hypothetical protein